jgi:hypothetical protein
LKRKKMRDHAAEEKARYHARKKRGVCVGCGAVPPAPSRVRCHGCLYNVRRSVTQPETRKRRNNMNPWAGG